MARQKTQIADDAGEAIPALDMLRTLMQQHDQLGRRLATIAQQAEAEMASLESQGKAFAAQLDEARGELVELRAAHEIEQQKRMIAEARVRKLEAAISGVQALCGDVMATSAPAPAPDDSFAQAAEPDTPTAADLPPETWGMTEAELDAFDSLVVAEGAADRKSMLRTLCVRALRNAGLLSEPHGTGGDIIGNALEGSGHQALVT